MLTKRNIVEAIEKYKSGERTNNFREPDWSHVIYKNEVFPAKAVWSLASGIPLADFNTNCARDGFSEMGFETIDIGKYDEQAIKS